jgi:tetratricopeptide (TPR) repeat protein
MPKNNKILFKAVSMLVLSIIVASCATLKTKTEVSKDYYNLGTEYYNLKNYKKAIESYEKSLQYDHGNKDAKINLVICYQMDRQFDKSERLIISNYKPQNNEFNRNLLLLLGNNYFLNADYDKALKTYNIYVESYPEKAEGFFNIGMTYQKLNDDENTLKYFLMSYNVDNKFIPAVYNLAVFYFDKKDYDNSIVYYRQLVDLDRQNPDVYYKLGLLEYQKEEYEIARDNFNKAAELDPKNPEFYISLAKVYAKAFNNKTKTFTYLEKAFILGYTDINKIKTIPEFNLMNEYSDYKDLLKRYSNR